MQQSINPSTGQAFAQYQEHDDAAITNAIAAGHEAFLAWRARPMAERSALVLQLAKVLRERQETLATLITNEMGKPLPQAMGEVEKCAQCCEYYAAHGASLLAPEALPAPEGKAFVHYAPMGLLLAVMPWNFPLWQVIRFAAPNLVGGNTILLKHAPNVPGCSLAIEEAFHAAGFPKHIFRSLLFHHDKVEQVVAHPLVKAATLTGSDRAGRSLAALCGKHLKKTVLELGGSDPFIVLEDADLEMAADMAVRSRMNNGGQTCIAAKRIIVEAPIASAFAEAITQRIKNLNVGDPLLAETNLGPMAREDLAENVVAQVNHSVSAGAQLLLGGHRLNRPGYFVAPTLLSNVTPGMPAHDEELFGPVAVLFTAKNAEHALALANNTPYGLGASIWTRNLEKAEAMAQRIESGVVYINRMVASHIAMPFGGTKQSGYGRELGHLGIREFMNAQTIWA